VGFVVGNHDVARSLALSAASDTQIGNFGSELGSFSVGTTVLRMPWCHELSLQRSLPGLTLATKCQACERLATTTW